MIRCIIVDDEPQSNQLLAGMLGDYFGDLIEIVDMVNSVEDAKTSFTRHKPELIFLDVQIHNETGFDLLKKINTENVSVIFITAFEKYAIQAFRFSAIDYLLKPVSPDDLYSAVSRILKRRNASDSQKRIETLLQNMHNKDKKIFIPDTSGFSLVNISDIVRCEANINYTTIVLQNASPIVVAKSLKEFELLLDGYNFFRVHKSHLINVVHVKNYKKDGGKIHLSNGDIIEISLRKKEDFFAKMRLHTLV